MSTISKMWQETKDAAKKVKKVARVMKLASAAFFSWVILAIIAIIILIFLCTLIYILTNRIVNSVQEEVLSVSSKSFVDIDIYNDIKTDEAPNYLQNNSKWKEIKLEDSTIQESGSGVCALAGAVSYMTGKQINPEDFMDELNGQVYKDGNVEKLVEMFENSAKLFGLEYSLFNSSISLDNLAQRISEQNTKMAIIATIDNQVVYIVSSKNKDKPIKVINSISDKKANKGKYFSGNLTIEDFESINYNIIGVFENQE